MGSGNSSTAVIFDDVKARYEQGVKDRELTDAEKAAALEELTRTVKEAQQTAALTDPDAPRITLYSTDNCRHCRAAKALFESIEEPFVEVNLAVYPSLRQPVRELAGATSVPQIWLNGEHVGGNAELQALFETGELSAKLEAMHAAAALSSAAPPLPPELTFDGLQKAKAAGATASSGDDEWLAQQGQDGDADDETKAQEGHVMTAREQELHATVERVCAAGRLDIRTRRVRFTRHPMCFDGAALVSALVADSGTTLTRVQAAAVGAEMLALHVLHHVQFSEPFADSGTTLFRFQRHAAKSVLNMKTVFNGTVRPAQVVATDLRARIADLYDRFLSADGRHVDYAGIQTSPQFAQYEQRSAELQRVDLGELGRAEKMAFFVNVYNAIVIHGIVSMGAPRSAAERSRFFSSAKYNIGGLDFALSDIEHGVLRGNRKAPYSLTFRFGTSDPRRFHIVPDPDPRVHFALVCGAKSCPPIKLYSSDNLEEGLQAAAESFFEDEDSGATLDVERAVLRVSKIVQWYKGDFGASDDEVIARLLPWFSQARRALVEQLQARGKLSLKYLRYDWTVNS